MNKIATIGAVIVLLIIVVAAAYFLMGKNAMTYTTTSTVGSTTLAYTTVGGSTSASTTIPANTSYSVKVESSATYGQYLTNASGYTLYTYGGDVRNSTSSSCSASCANVWPPFYVANLVVAPGLNASDFGIINRTGSGAAQQLTYKGWPLYKYVQDTAPGQINGNGVANFHVATK